MTESREFARRIHNDFVMAKVDGLPGHYHRRLKTELADEEKNDLVSCLRVI